MVDCIYHRVGCVSMPTYLDGKLWYVFWYFLIELFYIKAVLKRKDHVAYSGPETEYLGVELYSSSRRSVFSSYSILLFLLFYILCYRTHEPEHSIER